jgi:N-acetylneuraminic acid mutarotase
VEGLDGAAARLLAAGMTDGGCGRSWIDSDLRPAYEIGDRSRRQEENMRARGLIVAALVIPAWLSLSVDAVARDLTIAERVEAQDAIDRVYYAHQLGASRRFEEAFPRPMLEEKVRAYLRQTVALESLWQERITAEMLRGELDRVTRDTRMPDRLREIFAALRDDPFVIQECLLRPLLVERLARERFAADAPRPAMVSRAAGEREPREFSEWWARNERRFDEREVAAVASTGGALRLPEIETGVSCPPDQTWDNGSLSAYPIARRNHSAVWTGSLMVIWGGDVPGGHLDSGGRYDPATDTWSPTSTVNAPPGRSGHAAVWTGSEMIVWGGCYSGYCPPGGRYNPQTDTWRTVSLVNAPPPTSGSSVVWTGNRMIDWGGQSGSADIKAGWSYDPGGDTWAAISQINAPQERERHTAVWTGSRMLVWGGLHDGAHLDTGGAYDPSSDTWTPISSVGAPSPRVDHGAVWTGHFMVVWGGREPTGLTVAGGRYDPSTDTWLPTTTTNAPSGREVPPPVWSGSVMIVYGGWAGATLDTGALYDPEADVWTPTSTLNSPGPRRNHTMVWAGSRMVLWGGESDSFIYRTGSRYVPAADVWMPTSESPAPYPSSGPQSAVWTGSEMIVWGGVPWGIPNAETAGRYDPALDSWRPVSHIGAPSSRSGQMAVWTGGFMVVWGGTDNNTFTLLNTGGQYDPIGNRWFPMSTIGAPVARELESVVWTGSRMLVWGGRDWNTYFATGGIYDPVANTWSTISTLNAPSARAAASTVWTGTRMIVWGGFDGANSLRTGARYDPAGDRWETMAIANAPAKREGAVAVWTGKKMIVWGGSDNLYLTTGGLYDPALDQWSTMSTTGVPERRYFETAVWTGSRMIVWGGFGSGFPEDLNNGGIYDPVGDLWAATSLADAPAGREQHTAVWAGELAMMLIWGGGPAPLAGNGGRFAFGLSADVDHDGYTICDGDCNDIRPDVHPGAVELCNGLDDDCDGVADDLPSAFCDDGNACTTDVCGGSAGCLHPVRDNDGDGYGDGLCGGNDCDDLDPLRYPGAPERCNGLDDNCDGVADEGGNLLCNDQDVCTDVDVCLGVLGCFHHARDFDGDGHGDASCGGDDCTDVNPGVWFPAIEVATLSASGAIPTALAWTDQGAQVGPEIFYLLVSGAIAKPGTSGFVGASCLQAGMTTSFQDTRPNPSVGTAYWYLTGAVNECGAGTFGTAQRDAELSAVCQ